MKKVNCFYFDGGCCLNDKEFPSGVPTEICGDYCSKCKSYYPGNSKPKSVIVLENLLAGQTIEKDNYKYCFDESYKLCIVAYNEARKEDVLLPVNLGIELQDFIKWCDKFTFAELYLIGCQRVLQEIHRKDRG